MNYVFAGFIPVIAVCALLYFGNEDDGSPATPPDEVASPSESPKASIGDQKISHTAEKQTLYDAVVEIAAKANGAIVCDADAKAKLESKSVYIHVIDLPVKDVIDNIALIGEMTARIDGSDIIFDSEPAVIQCSNDAEGLENNRKVSPNIDPPIDTFSLVESWGVNAIIECNKLKDNLYPIRSLNDILISDYYYWVARYMEMKMAIRMNMIIITESKRMIIKDVSTNDKYGDIIDIKDMKDNNIYFCTGGGEQPFDEMLEFMSDIFYGRNILIDQGMIRKSTPYPFSDSYDIPIFSLMRGLSFALNANFIFIHGSFIFTNDEKLIISGSIIISPKIIKGTRYNEKLGNTLIQREMEIVAANDHDYPFFYYSSDMNTISSFLFSFTSAYGVNVFYDKRLNDKDIGVLFTEDEKPTVNEVMLRLLEKTELKCILTDGIFYIYDPKVTQFEFIDEALPEKSADSIP